MSSLCQLYFFHGDSSDLILTHCADPRREWVVPFQKAVKHFPVLDDAYPKPTLLEPPKGNGDLRLRSIIKTVPHTNTGRQIRTVIILDAEIEEKKQVGIVKDEDKSSSYAVSFLCSNYALQLYSLTSSLSPMPFGGLPVKRYTDELRNGDRAKRSRSETRLIVKPDLQERKK